MTRAVGSSAVLMAGLASAASLPAGAAETTPHRSAETASTGSTSSTTVGVTIDGKDYATDTPVVDLDLVWPAGATSVLVSNDASFDAAGDTESFSPRSTVRWTLPKTPPASPSAASTTTTSTTTTTTLPGSTTVTAAELQPRIVYVQFQGPGISPVTSYAHILLDQTTPSLSDAEVLPSPAPAKSAAKAHVTAKKEASSGYRVRVYATDDVSGIAEVQISPAPRGGVTEVVSPEQRKGYKVLSAVVTAKNASVPRYARVRSVSGEWSSWMPLTQELSAVDKPHGGEFVTAPNDAVFKLRGFDYQPVTAVRVKGKLQYANDTFSPGYYQSGQIGQALKQMEALHYNAVRAFIDPNKVGDLTGPGLDPGYLADLADFIRQAQADNIRVLLVTGQLPAAGGFAPKLTADFGIWNSYFLEPADVTAMKRYLSELVTDLRSSGAPLSDVLWELVGEQDWNNTSAPLSWKHGLVRTANGGTYNMASQASRADMETANLLYWTNTMSAVIHRMVPGSLVSLGFYAPSINLKRPGWTVRPQIDFTKLAKNDFVDVHAYSNLGSLQEQIDSFGGGSTDKPVIMGEFGAARSSFASPSVAAQGVVEWQRLTCDLGGLDLSGWLLWSWNSSAQLEYWTALDGRGAIEHAMSPVSRPNPCS